MGEIKGKLKICDRCKTEIFLKLKGKDSSFIDGEYSVSDKFEPTPEGWTYHNTIGVLCPECSNEYHNLITSFLNNNSQKDN